MANFSDYFANTFNTAYKSAQDRRTSQEELEFKKWVAEQESDPKAVAGKILPTAMLLGNQDLITKLLAMQKGEAIPATPQTDSTSWIDMGGSEAAAAPIDNAPIGQVGGATILPKSKYLTISADPTRAQVAKNQLATTQQTTEQGLFQKSFSRAYSELNKKYPEIGKVGFEGWLNRFHARNIGVPFDNLPETKAFVAELKPRANQQARTIEGGRVTDSDRKVYADAYPNALLNPSQTNIRLSSDALLGMDAKGGNIGKVVAQLLSSEVDIDNKIALQVLEEKIPNFSPQTHDVFVDDETGKIKVVPKEQ